MTDDPDYPFPFSDEENANRDIYDADRAPLVIVDRSDLERFAACPFSGRASLDGLVQIGNAMTNSGQEVHEAFSGAIKEYVESDRLDMSPKEFVDDVLGRLRHSRPDVQPDVLDAAERAVWKLSELVMTMNPRNVLKFDGGEGKLSGQLAIDLPECGIRYTSEVDFLHSGPSRKVLHVVDWKSGWKMHDAASNEKSFQFQTHAALVFGNYPEIDAVEITTFNTRRSTMSRPIEFDRKRDLRNIMARIHTAGTAFMLNRTIPLADVPTWAAVEKCRICDARKLCPKRPPNTVADDPGEFLKAYIAAAAKAEALKEELTEYVDAQGEDIVTPDGDAFGRDKPASERKVSAAIYSLTPGLKEQRAGSEPRAPKVSKPRKEKAAEVSGLDEVFARMSQQTPAT